MEIVELECAPCARGYYKNNGDNRENDLGACVICPDADTITEGTGAMHVDNCTFGEYLNNVPWRIGFIYINCYFEVLSSVSDISYKNCIRV